MVHPIINRIKEGKESITRLIPTGSKNDNFWLPNSLKIGA
jgi:hypothetical protein